MEYKNFNKETDWMGVDFDGTLHLRPRDKPLTVLGPPLQPMVDLVKEWLANGMKVKIFTARASNVGLAIGPNGREPEKQVALIEEWCEKYVGQKLEVTCEKDGFMYQLYDDRAVCVEHNTGNIIGMNSGW